MTLKTEREGEGGFDPFSLTRAMWKIGKKMLWWRGRNDQKENSLSILMEGKRDLPPLVQSTKEGVFVFSSVGSKKGRESDGSGRKKRTVLSRNGRSCAGEKRKERAVQ